MDVHFIESEIINIVSSNVSALCNDIVVTKESHLVNDLGFDSITLMQLIVELEELFGIEMDDADYDDIVYINTLITYVHDKLGEKVEEQ